MHERDGIRHGARDTLSDGFLSANSYHGTHLPSCSAAAAIISPHFRRGQIPAGLARRLRPLSGVMSSEPATNTTQATTNTASAGGANPVQSQSRAIPTTQGSTYHSSLASGGGAGKADGQKASTLSDVPGAAIRSLSLASWRNRHKHTVGERRRAWSVLSRGEQTGRSERNKAEQKTAEQCAAEQVAAEQSTAEWGLTAALLRRRDAIRERLLPTRSGYIPWHTTTRLSVAGCLWRATPPAANCLHRLFCHAVRPRLGRFAATYGHTRSACGGRRVAASGRSGGTGTRTHADRALGLRIFFFRRRPARLVVGPLGALEGSDKGSAPLGIRRHLP